MSFTFGTPSTAPATTGLTGGFNFSTNKPATPSFGLAATAQQSTGLFGTTPATSTPAFGAFGAPATQTFGAAATPSFGTTPAFGATSTAPAFGATSTAPAFGATSTAPAFGAASNIPAFGASAAAPAFGATTAPAFGASTTPAFGANTTPALGSTAAAPAFGTASLSFGAATSTAPATGLSFGATSTAASTGLGGLGGFGFGAATTTQGLGLFGSTGTATTSTSFFGTKLGTTTVTGAQLSTSATPSLGLGGVSTIAGGFGATNTTAATDGKSESPKQTKLPNEISTNVESFKEFVKKQKSLSLNVMRVSIKPLHKVSQEAETTFRQTLALSSEISRGRAQARRLRAAAAAALAAAETVARDPPGSELDGSAPPQYIKELISELEQQIITFRRQLDEADKQMQTSPKLLSEQELTLGIRRMHESLVALAGRLQAVHSQVEAQKDQYLNLRKYILKDPTNVFKSSPGASLDEILKEAEGTRKKVKIGGLTDSTLGSAVLTDPRAALGNVQQLAGPTPFSYLGSTLSAFPTADTSGTSWQPQAQANTSFNTSGFGASSSTEVSAGFQLQKPPGKRVKQ